MIDIWRPGDLALCIKQGNWRMAPTGEEIDTGPRAGQIVPVFFVGRAEVMKLGRRVMLGFREWPGDQFVADKFIKLDPRAPEIATEADGEIAPQTEPRRIDAGRVAPNILFLTLAPPEQTEALSEALSGFSGKCEKGRPDPINIED